MISDAATSHSDDRASPLKPNDPTSSMSLKDEILDVHAFAATYGKSSGEIPFPLSDTSKESVPNSLNDIMIAEAPASRAFSTSSFTATERLVITWPLQMR